MYAGHLAAGLVLKKAEKRVNLGLLFFAALLPDFLLGIFALLGMEQIHVPANYGDLHYLTFTFPYSHGLIASLAWSLLAFVIVKVIWRANKASTRMAVLVAVAVFSHFVLDVIVHIPEMPLLGANSYQLGLSLGNTLGLALALEIALAVVGLFIYLKATPSLSRMTRNGLILLVAFVSVLTISVVFSDAAPPPAGVAGTLLIQVVVPAGIAYWLDRKKD